MKSIIRYTMLLLIGGVVLIQSLCLSAREWKSVVHPDEVVGIWLTNKQDSKVEIYKNPDGTFSGKIIWARPPHGAFEGTEVMRGVTYNVKENTYTCPWIYTPRLKITAKAILSLEEDALHIKATKGLVTTHQVFTRVK